MILHGLDFFVQHISQTLLEICRQLKQLELFVMYCTSSIPEQFFKALILLKQATAIREYHLHKEVYLVCNNVYVGGTCLSNIHTNARTEGVVAQHCPEHYMACLLPILHAMYYRKYSTFPDKQCTHTRQST